MVLLEETPVAGKTKIDMSTLIQQGMISIAHNYYSLMIHKRFIFTLPNPDRDSIADCANWLYVSVDLDEEEDYDAENVVAGEPMNEDVQHQEPVCTPSPRANPTGFQVIVHESRPVSMGTNRAR